MQRSIKNQSLTAKPGLVVLVVGGSGVGKTSAAGLLDSQPGWHVMRQDNYMNRSNAPMTQYGPNNDHPDVTKLDKLIEDVQRAMHKYSVVIVEGTLLLHQKQIRELSNLSVFLQLNDKERLKRRKSKTPLHDHVYVDTVLQSSHHTYVEPSQKFADRIIMIDDLSSPEIANKLKEHIEHELLVRSS